MIARTAAPARVLMTADTVGGVWTYSIELARALGVHGVRVVLATMGARASSEQRAEARAIDSLELYESEYRLPWMEHPWADVEMAGDWLLDLVAKTSPDLVHLNDPVYGSRNWPVPTVAVVHSCVLSWWQSVWGRPAPTSWTHYRREMTQGLQGTTAVVAPSTWMLETVGRNYGVRGGRVIANGRDSQAFAPKTKAPLVFAAGRMWDRGKNLQALEAVAGDLLWPVYLAGDLQEPGRDGAISEAPVHRLGRLPPTEVAAWLGQASIYAFPAKYEPFGLSVLEAALAGCALVLGDIPTLRELWEGAAIFVSPDDSHTLRLAIHELITDSRLRQALATRARRRALTFTPERMARSYLDLYAELFTTAAVHTREPACAL